MPKKNKADLANRKARSLEVWHEDERSDRTEFVEWLKKFGPFPDLKLSELAAFVEDFELDENMPDYVPRWIRAYDAICNLGYDMEDLRKVIKGDLKMAREMYFDGAKASKADCLEAECGRLLDTFSCIFDLIVRKDEETAPKGEAFRRIAKQRWRNILK